MHILRRGLAFRMAPNRVILHTALWLCVLVFYAANYSRVIDSHLIVPFVAKNLLIVMALFYSLPFFMDNWMARGMTIGSLLSLLLFGLLGYSVWAGAGALLCLYASRYAPATSDSLAYLASLLLDGGFLSVYTPSKFAVLALDFTFLVSAPLAGRLVSEVKKRDWAKQQLESDLLRSENSRLNAELKQLKAQLPPHFLFNTLNNIHSLVEPVHVPAAKAIFQLAQLTRYTSYQGVEDFVPLAQELDAVNDYWHLSAMRLPDTVALDKELSKSGTDGLRIPPMLLLVYVENAFKHGPGRSPRGAWVRLAVTVSQGTLTLDLSNSVDHQAPKPPSGNLGLHHARQLLERQFPARYIYMIETTANQYRVQLTSPISAS